MSDLDQPKPMYRCLSCDTVTEWDNDECPNCGYSEGMLEEDEEE